MDDIWVSWPNDNVQITLAYLHLPVILTFKWDKYFHDLAFKASETSKAMEDVLFRNDVSVVC